MPLIACQNVSLSYDKRVVAANITFQVNKGEYLCIVGENGSGKSTLVKALVGLKSPAQGTIQFSDGFSRREIGYLPQQTVVQKDFPASVQEVVLSGYLGQKAWPFYTKQERAHAIINMEKTGVSDLRHACYRELSGGQQQRVLLARALCAAQKLLLLDEPTAGLDPVASSELYTILDTLHSAGMAVIMVSHDILSAVRHADTILHLRHETLYYGPAGEYMHSEAGGQFLGGDKQ